jgi:hypothetical protein
VGLNKEGLSNDIDLFDVIGLVRMVLSPLHHFLPSDRDDDYAGPIDMVLTESINRGTKVAGSVSVRLGVLMPEFSK